MADFRHIKLAESQRKELSMWIEGQLSHIEDLVEARSGNWRLFREMYEGKTEPKNFPWVGASNVHVPLTGIMVDAIHANMMNRLYGYDRLWDVISEHPSEPVGFDRVTGQTTTWADIAKSIQAYFKWESGDMGPIGAYSSVNDAVLECIKLGTMVFHTPWMTISRPDFVYNPEMQTIEKGVQKTLFDGPKLDTIPLEDFAIMPNYYEIHGPHASPLVGHKELWRRGQIAQAVAEGKFTPQIAERLNIGMRGWDASQEMKDHQARLEGETDGLDDTRPDDARIHKLWLEVDVNGDDIEESVYVEFHKDTGTICRITPYLYPTRPYEASRYVRRERRFYGIGVPEMLLSLQQGVNTSLNQTIDNATIANIRGFAVRRKSVSAKSLDNWYPGKKILFDQEGDIKDFQLGEVYPSGFEVGRVLQTLAEKRVGIGDPDLGRDVPGNYQGTAGTTFALLQQSAQRFDLYAKDIRRALSEIGMQLLERIQQFKPVERMYAVMGDKGQLVEAALTLPREANLRQHIRVSTTSSTSSSNKEVARQNALTAFGILTQYFEKMFELSQIVANPTAPAGLRTLANDMINVGEKLMGKVLEGFDMTDIAASLPQTEGLLNEQAQPGPIMDPNGGPGPEPNPADQSAGMESPGEDVVGPEGFGPGPMR
jgi:hypothetical protein